MFTEEEAKTKWCFECAKSPLSDETERYGPHDGVIGARCLASGCMAWRWGISLWVGKNKISGERHSTDYAPSKYVCRGWKYTEQKRGYCGLAGTPER